VICFPSSPRSPIPEVDTAAGIPYPLCWTNPTVPSSSMMISIEGGKSVSENRCQFIGIAGKSVSVHQEENRCQFIGIGREENRCQFIGIEENRDFSITGEPNPVRACVK
jgi:hypothetical protein